jgi:putative nucleotidyltransferase with HDIG domain
MPTSPLLVSDTAHLAHARKLATDFGLKTIGLDAVADVPKAATLVFDVDIRAREVITRVKSARRPVGQAWVFLLDATSDLHAARTQAHALGASETIFRESAATALARRLSLNPAYPLTGPRLDRLKAKPAGAAVESAGRLLSSLFSAVSEDRTISGIEIRNGAALLAKSLGEVDLAPWLDTVRDHHEGTFQHCLLVSATAAAYARAYMTGEQAQTLIAAAILHDIGKADIPVHILDKAGGLTPEEFAVIARHPVTAFDRLRSWGVPAAVLRAVRGHHEALDGSGYPDKLSGDRIDLVTRVLTVCDVYAALSEARSYRPPLPREEAIAVLVEMALRGQLDYPVVSNLSRLIGTQIPATIEEVRENLRRVKASAG